MIDSILLDNSPLKVISFSKGPSIRVLCYLDAKGYLIKTSLEEASSFEALFFGCLPPKPLETWLEGYAQKSPPALLPILLDLSSLTPFRQKVLVTLQKIPFGQVITYGKLSLESGYPKAFQAVGQACHFNPFPLLIPCHRVISTSGLGGYAFPMRIKRQLLQFENL